MTWLKEVEDIKHRHTLAEHCGGEDAVKRQHDNGKLTVRERID